MAIRYFKCHTLPYPSYGLAVASKATDQINVAWSNGPPGQSEPTTTELGYTYATASSTENIATLADTGRTAASLYVPGQSGNSVSIRIRRINTAGAGEWTPAIVDTFG
jgi:hypothetical protein